MKLYLISQNTNTNYDTYDSAVVAAKSEELARMTPPGGGEFGDWLCSSTWAEKPEHVVVKLIGVATKGTEAGVILASFNAG